ncbi:hypothetical protein HMPREF1705_04748 [Acetomicrobium hydrogeniformans ATCC BAA-1850]|uniref:Uncharacterized protein n=1 Tax=Acetomicrobium hydrogeniformans ATCC BAA-1850 TaxID=592015 RepID=A0A0T5X9L6_9BACT|nr:hypothetical protein HMPREF1705_04748 [Acetomicrobium hydrogeniformans ATCC BAA-1850]
MWTQLSAFLTIDPESVLAGKLLWKLFLEILHQDGQERCT